MLSIHNNQILANNELIGYHNEYYYNLEGNVIADNELDFYWWVYNHLNCKSFVNPLDSEEKQISRLIFIINEKLRRSKAKVSSSNVGEIVGIAQSDSSCQ